MALDFERHGPVSRDAARDQLDPATAIFSSVWTVAYFTSPPSRVAPPAFGEAVLGLDLGEVLR